MTPQKPQKGNLATTMETLDLSYVISLEIFIESGPQEGEVFNIFHFSDLGESCCELGERTLALYLKYGPDFTVYNLNIFPKSLNAGIIKNIPMKKVFIE